MAFPLENKINKNKNRPFPRFATVPNESEKQTEAEIGQKKRSFRSLREQSFWLGKEGGERKKEEGNEKQSIWTVWEKRRENPPPSLIRTFFPMDAFFKIFFKFRANFKYFLRFLHFFGMILYCKM